MKNEVLYVEGITNDTGRIWDPKYLEGGVVPCNFSSKEGELEVVGAVRDSGGCSAVVARKILRRHQQICHNELTNSLHSQRARDALTPVHPIAERHDLTNMVPTVPSMKLQQEISRDYPVIGMAKCPKEVCRQARTKKQYPSVVERFKEVERGFDGGSASIHNLRPSLHIVWPDRSVGWYSVSASRVLT